MLTRIQYSLSAKLVVLFICAGAILLLLVGLIVGKGFSQHFRSSTQPFMMHYVELMQHQLGSPPQLEKALGITSNTPVDIHVFGPDSAWTTAHQQLDRSELVSAGENSGNVPQSRFQLSRIGERIILQSRDGEFELYFEIDAGDDLVAGTDYNLVIFLCVLGVLILMYYATRAIFLPIRDIERGVRLFGEGNLDHKIPKTRNDQLGDLTDSINRMADDIYKMLEAKRQFLLGISHELRSPLTRCKVNLALLDDSPARSEVDRDIQAMDDLIEELLESERLNSPHRVIDPKSLRVDELVQQVIDTEFDQHQVTTQLDNITAELDPARTRLLVRNLIQNAIKYSDKDTPPAVNLAKTATGFELAVRDYGKGISREHLPFLTEPFYRADPSRQRLTGGYGLGLYLCRMIMQAHSGTIDIQSTPGKGTRIACSFPLAVPAKPVPG